MMYINQKIKTDTRASGLINHIGETVTIHGTVHKIRRMSGFAFVILRTESGLLQCIYDEKYARFSLSELTDNTAISATGIIAPESRSRMGFELKMLEIKVLSVPEEEPPVVINNKEIDAGLESLLDYRPITLRNPKERAIFKIQSEITRGIRNYLEENAFTEIHTPKLVSGTAEGGANVFKLDYFGKEAFLTQSPQFYKQIMIGVFEKVYEIAPVFRAEKHDTSRHINEYTSIDLEMGFIKSYRELMQLETDMLIHTFRHIEEKCADEILLTGAKVPHFSEIPAITFREAKILVSETYKREITDDDDFEPEEEKLLCEIIKRECGSELVFVTEYKASKRPFYTMNNRSNPSVTESFDLLFRGLEITTGGQRIHTYGEQVKKMKERGMNIDAFSSYLMAHKYGLPPHGGMGIGLERLTARLLDFENVRRAALFPRDIKRILP